MYFYLLNTFTTFSHHVYCFLEFKPKQTVCTATQIREVRRIDP